MPYYEIDRVAAGAAYRFKGPFEEGDAIHGKIRRVPVDIVIQDDDSAIMSNVVMGFNKSILLDTEGRLLKVRRLITWLELNESLPLILLRAVAHEPLFGRIHESELAKKLAELYKNRVEGLEGETPHESLIYKLGQWAVGLIALDIATYESRLVIAAGNPPDESFRSFHW